MIVWAQNALALKLADLSAELGFEPLTFAVDD
jgi:hypothetical protein